MRPRVFLWASVFLLFLLLVVTLSGCSDGSTTPTPSTSATPSPVGVPVAPTGDESIDGPSLPTNRVGNGVWMVNSEIIPGVYAIDVPEGEACYWERLKGTDGNIDAIIENGLIEGPAHAEIRVRKSDNAVRSDGCPAWVLIGH